MTKTQIVDQLAADLGISKAKARRAFDKLVNTLATTILSNGRVVLPGFGTFKLKERAARKGRNPQTGEELLIPERKTIVFKPWKGLI